MPKKIINIANYSKGLNNNTNARDLEPNEFAVINGLDNEIPGRLRTYGDVTDGEAYSENTAGANNFIYGNGLSYITLDRDPGDTNPTTNLDETELYLINDYPNSTVDFYDGSDNEEMLSQVSYGTDDSPIDSYVIDGQVRISATDHTKNNNTPKWYGYVDGTYNLGSSGASTGDGISDTVDQVAKTYNSFFAADSYPAPINTTDLLAYDAEFFTDTNKITIAQSEIVLNPSFALANTTDSQITATYNTHALLDAYLDGAANFTEGYGGFGMFCWFNNSTTAANQQDATKNYTPVYSSQSGIKYSLFASNVYDSQESYPIYLGDILQPSWTSGTYNRALYLMIMGRMPKKPRQTGIKVYWSKSEGTGTRRENFGQKYLFFELDFTKGIRFAGADIYNSFGHLAGSTDANKPDNAYFIFPAGNTGHSYVYGERISQLSQKEPYLNFKPTVVGRLGSGYKTSTVANRRAYIGNVAIYENNNKVVKSDTVYKSRVNQFDTFQEDAFIDVEINDGDEIIALESLGTKLLQYKKNTLYVINVSRDIEFLENSYEYKGAEKDYHIVKGEGFVAWFNKIGMFMYANNKLIDLTLNEDGQPRLANWRGQYYHDNAVLGYEPDKKTLFLFNSNNQSVLQFDIKSQSFSFNDNVTGFDDKKISNIITNKDGEMVYLYQATTTNYPQTLKKWRDASQNLLTTASDVILQTKDYDMGTPDVNKNICTVYVNYKQPSTSRVKVFGVPDVDGGAVDLGALPHTGSNGFTTHKINVTSSNLKNIKSFALQFQSYSDGEINSGFVINDIQIVYRDKVRR